MNNGGQLGKLVMLHIVLFLVYKIKTEMIVKNDVFYIKEHETNYRTYVARLKNFVDLPSFG